MSSESRSRASDHDYCCTNVDHTGMVYSSSKFADRPPQSFQDNQGCSIQSSPGQYSPLEPQISVNGMQNIRHNLLNLNVSGNQALRNNIQFTLQSGPSFVFQGKLIQCDLL
jgi:hypothetical protein